MQTNEELLAAWLRLSTSINNSRLVPDMPYNESLICNILSRNEYYHPGSRLTATELCAETKILKSQMNRILNEMEKKSLITKERSGEDKRKVYIRLIADPDSLYSRQHAKILELLDAVIDGIGEEKALYAVQLLNTISDIANTTFYK